MITKEYSSVDDVIKWHLSVKEKQYFEHVGLKFCVLPNVFCPFVAPSGKLSLTFSTFPSLFNNKNILEIGCGSGIVSLLMAQNGAKFVLGVDKNKEAIENSHINQTSMGIKNCEFRKGNLFDSLKEDELSKIDIIFADLPLINSDNINLNSIKDSPLYYAFYDDKYSSTIQYIKKTIEIIKKNKHTRGYICLSSFDEKFQKNIESELNCSLVDFITIDLNWVCLHVKEIEV